MDGNDGDLISVGTSNIGSRKKAKKITKRKREQADRHQIPLFDDLIKCNHTKKKVYQCNDVTLKDIQEWRNKLYHGKSKVEQDQQICRFLAVGEPSRKRGGQKSRQISISYAIPYKNSCKTVCSRFFLSAFKLSRARVIRLSKILERGDIPKERRGGDKISHKLATSREEVRDFLKGLKGTESHYGRNKSQRIYLNCNLTIKKLFRLYRSSAKIKTVSFSTFQRIFAKEFNIGFKCPAADICSLCERLTNSIKRETNPGKKMSLQVEKRIHKMRANHFYKLMKEIPENCLAYCFDLQQVQPLPKTAVSDAFYLRQISYYTFGIVPVGPGVPNFFSWTEDEAGRGCVEVASALLHFLNSLEISPEINAITLFCDGCAGQNKNSHVIHMLMYWLANTATSITLVKIVFPVRGHSFLPADRAFGRVEKLLRKETFIKKKEQYHKIYKEVGKVYLLEKDWKLMDIKSLEKSFKKLTGISDMKRLIIEKRSEDAKIKILVRGHQNYRVELEIEMNQNLCKRGTKLSNLILPELKIGRPVAPKKLENILSLLKAEYGADWNSDSDLAWYKNLLQKPQDANYCRENSEQALEEPCLCLDEDPGFHI